MPDPIVSYESPDGQIVDIAMSESKTFEENNKNVKFKKYVSFESPDGQIIDVAPEEAMTFWNNNREKGIKAREFTPTEPVKQSTFAPQRTEFVTPVKPEEVVPEVNQAQTEQQAQQAFDANFGVKEMPKEQQAEYNKAMNVPPQTPKTEVNPFDAINSGGLNVMGGAMKVDEKGALYFEKKNGEIKYLQSVNDAIDLAPAGATDIYANAYNSYVNYNAKQNEIEKQKFKDAKPQDVPLDDYTFKVYTPDVETQKALTEQYKSNVEKFGTQEAEEIINLQSGNPWVNLVNYSQKVSESLKRYGVGGSLEDYSKKDALTKWFMGNAKDVPVWFPTEDEIKEIQKMDAMRGVAPIENPYELRRKFRWQQDRVNVESDKLIEEYSKKLEEINSNKLLQHDIPPVGTKERAEYERLFKLRNNYEQILGLSKKLKNTNIDPLTGWSEIARVSSKVDWSDIATFGVSGMLDASVKSGVYQAKTDAEIQGNIAKSTIKNKLDDLKKNGQENTPEYIELEKAYGLVRYLQENPEIAPEKVGGVKMFIKDIDFTKLGLPENVTNRLIDVIMDKEDFINPYHLNGDLGKVYKLYNAIDAVESVTPTTKTERVIDAMSQSLPFMLQFGAWAKMTGQTVASLEKMLAKRTAMMLRSSGTSGRTAINAGKTISKYTTGALDIAGQTTASPMMWKEYYNLRIQNPYSDKRSLLSQAWVSTYGEILTEKAGIVLDKWWGFNPASKIDEIASGSSRAIKNINNFKDAIGMNSLISESAENELSRWKDYILTGEIDLSFGAISESVISTAMMVGAPAVATKAIQTGQYKIDKVKSRKQYLKDEASLPPSIKNSLIMAMNIKDDVARNAEMDKLSGVIYSMKEDDLRKVFNYIHSKTVYDVIRAGEKGQLLNESKKKSLISSANFIAKYAKDGTNEIVLAEDNQTGDKYYVLSGDLENSDGTVSVVNLKTGEPKLLKPKQIKITDRLTGDELQMKVVDEGYRALSQQFEAKEAEEDANDAIISGQGGVWEVSDEVMTPDGRRGVVTSENDGQGNYTVTLDTPDNLGEPVVISGTELKSYVAPTVQNIPMAENTMAENNNVQDENTMVQNTTETPMAENTSQEPQPKYPTTKDGEVDFDAMDDTQLFEYNKETYGIDDAIAEIDNELNLIDEEKSKLETKIVKSSMKDRAKIKSQIAQLAQRRANLEAIKQTNIGEPQDAIKEGNIAESNQPERIGVAEQEQGEQTDRIDQKTNVPVAETETGGGNIAEQGRKVKEEVITEDEYLAKNGAPFMGGAEPALHKNIKDNKAKQENINRMSEAMRKNNELRDMLRKEYAKKVANGEIRPPTRIETLISTANGDEDFESTKAARRLLEKRGINWNKEAEQVQTQKIEQNEVQTETTETTKEEVITPERFEGIPEPKTIEEFESNLNEIISQYPNRVMAGVQAELYLLKYQDVFGKEYMDKYSLKSREDLKNHVAKLQIKLRAGKGKERTEALNQAKQNKSNQVVDEITAMARQAEADMQEQIKQRDLKEEVKPESVFTPTLRKQQRAQLTQLQGRAKNALPIVVVNNMKEFITAISKDPIMTENKIKEAKKSVKDGWNVSGLRTDTAVYINLESHKDTESVIKTWMHEQVGHAGIFSLFPKKEKQDELFTRIFDDIGADAIKSTVGEQYEKVFADKTEADQKIAWAKEYVARIAEKLDANEALTASEQSTWDKILQYIDALLNAITNNTVKWSEENVMELAKVSAKKLAMELPKVEVKEPQFNLTKSTIKKLESENKSTLPKIPTNKIFKNEVSQPNRATRSLADEYIDKLNKLPIQSVDVNKIIPTQKNVTITNLKDVANVKEEPFLLNDNGDYYVLDGHHRISNQILNGAESIDARVYEPQFNIIGEKGATALDKAEEATTRLDNLAIAKEMESGKRNVLRVDENGRNIVWENDDYMISVNDPENATYIALWNNGKKVGELFTTKGRNSATNGYLSIQNVEIDKQHRGKGLSSKMYDALLNHLGEKYKGISSENEQRVNKKQVPQIWKRLNAAEVDGNYTVDKKTFTPQEIRLATGWEKGVDGLWRYDEEVSPTDLEAIKQQAISDGTFMKAPNGQPTNLNERQWLQTRTPEFMNWFGDFIGDPENASQVKDENGEPLVVYHGTSADFDEFEKMGMNDLGLWGKGYYFTTKIEHANSYAEREGEGANIIPVYLSIQNPLKLTTDKDFTIRMPDGTNFRDLLKPRLDGSKIKEIAKSNNNDGVIQTIINGKIGDLVVFSPTQIKSATANVGTFSPSDANIMFNLTPKDASDIESHLSNLYDSNYDEYEKIFNLNTLDNYDVKNVVVPDDIESQMYWQEKLVEKVFNDLDVKYTKHGSKSSASTYYSLEKNDGDSFKLRVADHKIKYDADANIEYDESTTPDDIIQSLSEQLPSDVILKTEDSIGKNYTEIKSRPINKRTVSENNFVDAIDNSLDNTTEPNFNIVSKEDYKEPESSLKDIVNNNAPEIKTPLTPEEDAKLRAQLSKEVKMLQSFTDDMRMKMQDKNLSVRRMQEVVEKLTGKKILPSQDIYDALEKYSSQVYGRMELYSKNERQNLIDVIGKLGKKYKYNSVEVEDYLLAKHSLERHDSGISALSEDPEAEWNRAKVTEIINNFENNVTPEEVAELWNAVNAVNDVSIKALKDSGFISKEQYDFYKERWQHYVPLRGWELPDDIQNQIEMYTDVDYDGTPVKVKTTAKATKQAKGRTSKPDAPIQYMDNLVYSSMITAEKNKAMQKFGNLVRDNKDLTELFEMSRTYLMKVGEEPVLDAEGNQVYYKTKVDEEGNPIPKMKGVWQEIATLPENASELYEKKELMHRANKDTRDFIKYIPNHIQQQNTVEFYENGNRYIINVKQPDVAQAINMENNMKLPKFINMTLGNLNRFVSANFTALNPDFIPVNFLRDVQYAILSANINKDWRINGADVAKNLPISTKTISRYLTGKSDPINNKDDAMYELFMTHGGRTGFIHMRSLEKFKKQLDREMRMAMGSGSKGRKFLDYSNNFLKNNYLNSALKYGSEVAENMSRYSVFKSALDKGYTFDEASTMAKNVTVNFNRKGKWAPLFSSLFAFYNASTQGAHMMAYLTKHNKGAMMRTALAFMIAGGIWNEIARMMAGDDDKGNNKYDLLNDYTKGSNIVIPIGDTPITIPLPQGFKVFWVMGQIADDMILGRKSIKDGALDFTDAFISGFSPIGVQVSNFGKTSDIADENRFARLFRPVVPTAIIPAYDLAMNENYFGSKIYKEPMFNKKYMPASERGMNNVNPNLEKLAKWLNRLDGGNEFKSSGWRADWNPSKAEYVAEYFGGGRLKFWNKTWKTVAQIWDEDIEMKAKDMPILGRFTTELKPKNYSEDFNKVAEKIREATYQYGGYSKDKEDKYSKDKEAIEEKHGTTYVGTGSKYHKKLKSDDELNEVNEKLKDLNAKMNSAETKEEEEAIKKEINDIKAEFTSKYKNILND